MRSSSLRKYRHMPSRGIILLACVVLASCTSGGNDGLQISHVIVSSASAPTLTEPLPSNLPISPACKLLSTNEVKAVLGDNALITSGTKVYTTDAAKIPLYVDLCSWQLGQGAASTTVQIQVDTASSEHDASLEYAAQVKLMAQHVNPIGTTEPISGIGTQATLLPGWLIAQKGIGVLTVTASLSSGVPSAQTLRQLTTVAAKRLGWS